MATGSGNGPDPPLPSTQRRNDFDEDLVYLVGGERREMEIAEFPKLGKTVLRVGREAKVVDNDHVEVFWKWED
jgi:uncharacterized cupin superfamily protein